MNCWKKAGEVAEPSHDPFDSDEEDEDTDEIGGGLWASITHHFPALAEISFSHFASSDNDVVHVTESQPMEEDGTHEALEAVQSAESTSHEEEEAGEDSDGISL